MKLTIEIKMDNAAFRDADGDVPAHGPEVARILRAFAGRIADFDDMIDVECPFHDSNGNRVGRAYTEAEEDLP